MALLVGALLSKIMVSNILKARMQMALGELWTLDRRNDDSHHRHHPKKTDTYLYFMASRIQAQSRMR